MMRILITGAAGRVGQTLIAQPEVKRHSVLACDINTVNSDFENLAFETLDVRDGNEVHRVFSRFKPEIVVHLASIVTPPKGTGREFAYQVDVEGTRNIVSAALKQKTRRLVVTSSGAAYGYHKENAAPLTEDDPIRGNFEFPYSHHKRLVEELLADLRTESPELEQVILRVGTILGEGLENQITALFHKPRLLGIWNNESPFVFIWDIDLAKILLQACEGGKPGIYNVAGDGALGISEISRTLGKPILRFPAWVLKLGLAIASPLGLSRYGPEQVRFLQYRPVLDNTKLKEEFGYVPQKTSAQAFESWRTRAGL